MVWASEYDIPKVFNIMKRFEKKNRIICVCFVVIVCVLNFIYVSFSCDMNEENAITYR